MKKNYLFGLLSLLTVLFMASCQEEDVYGGASDANTDVVTFNVNTELVGTRAATGEGALATKLYYGVYEFVDTNNDGQNEWSLVESISKLEASQAQSPKTESDGSFEVNIILAKQKQYSVIFWAQSEADNKLCTVDWEKRELKINTDSASANQESYDAFWGYDEVTLTGALKREKLLVRPFAQLNIGVSDDDWNAAIAASVELQNSAVTVKKVPTTMSLVNGTVGEFTDASYVAYASAAIPSTDWTFPVDSNKYLALNYVLVGTEQSLIDVELAYTDSENGSYSSTFTSVPVRRNYRTNIYGNLLTNDAEYSVKIEAGINTPDNDLDDNTDGISRSSVSTVEELQEAINNAKAGETNVISFENDINGTTTRSSSAATIIVPQTEGVNIVIDGRGYKFDGTFYIYGHARHNGEETLKFTNINFEHADGAIYFISCNETDAESRYAHNVTVENCTFTGNDNGDVVGMRFRQCYDINVVNCTATNMHSLMWATATNGITIDNVTITNPKEGGVSLGTSFDLVVKNSTITAAGDYTYGIRVDASGAYNLSVENNTITAGVPVLLRNATGAYALNLSGNTLTTNKDYELIICNNNYKEDVDLVEPTGNYTVTGLTKGLKMFPVKEVLHAESGLYYNGNNNPWQSVFYLYDAEDLAKAATYFSDQNHSNEANGVTFELLADIDMDGKAWTPWSVMWITLNGNNHTISNVNVAEGWRVGLFGYLGAAKVNDLTLENVTVAGAQVGILAGSVEGVTTNNVTIKGNNSVSYKAYSSAEYIETWGGLGAVTGVVANSTINATIAENATVALNDNGVETVATFVNFLSGYLQENKGIIVNNGTVSVKASAPIVANAKGITYKGSGEEIHDAFVFSGEMIGDANIKVERTYGSIFIEDVTANVNGDLCTVNDRNTVVLWDCNITLEEGKKLVVFNNVSSPDAQVLLHNVVVNGVKLTRDNAAQYLEGYSNIDFQ